MTDVEFILLRKTFLEMIKTVETDFSKIGSVMSAFDSSVKKTSRIQRQLKIGPWSLKFISLRNRGFTEEEIVRQTGFPPRSISDAIKRGKRAGLVKEEV